jgi:hypothetical protein
MILVTFHLFVFGAIFFRAKNMADAWYVTTHFPGLNFSDIKLYFKTGDLLVMTGLAILLLAVHFVQEKWGSIRQMLKPRPLILRWAVYYLFVMSLFAGMYKTAQFIYFQF